MLGTALAAALSLAAQTPSTGAPASPRKPMVKKHKKIVKKTAAAPVSSTVNAPVKK
jgi:hypothetical protein